MLMCPTRCAGPVPSKGPGIRKGAERTKTPCTGAQWGRCCMWDYAAFTSTSKKPPKNSSEGPKRAKRGHTTYDTFSRVTNYCEPNAAKSTRQQISDPTSCVPLLTAIPYMCNVKACNLSTGFEMKDGPQSTLSEVGLDDANASNSTKV